MNPLIVAIESCAAELTTDRLRVDVGLLPPYASRAVTIDAQRALADAA
jgi:hypothetical protein